MKNIIRVAVIGMTDNKGGIESVIMNLYRNIDRDKIQFDFLIPYNKAKIAYQDEILAMGGRIFNIIWPQRESIKKAKESYLTFFREHPEVKVVHLHVNYPFVFPLKIAKKAGVPVRIIHAHSSAALFDKKQRRIIYKIRNFIIRNQIKKYANYYFACSDLAAEATFGKRRYIWIKNGIETKKYIYDEEIRNKIRREYGIKEEIVIGYVGKLSKQKNTMFILNVFKEFLKINVNSKLIMVGDGEEKKNLMKASKAFEIDKSVVLTGMKSNTSEFYNAFDLLLLPSEYEGFPVVLIEAQVSGVPCLVSNTITKQAKISNLVHYESLCNDAKIWANRMMEIISKKHTRQKYEKKDRINEFSTEKMVEMIEKYYYNLEDRHEN